MVPAHPLVQVQVPLSGTAGMTQTTSPTTGARKRNQDRDGPSAVAPTLPVLSVPDRALVIPYARRLRAIQHACARN